MSEKVIIAIIAAFTVILLAGFWVIPHESIAQVSGILGVALPAIAKVYQAIKNLSPKFEIEIDGAKDITMTLPRNIGRIKMSIKNAKNITVEGAGDDIILKKE